MPAFVPTGRYTEERKQQCDKLHDGDFLWPEERRLLHYFMCLHNDAFAWDDSERGRFKEEYFPPIPDHLAETFGGRACGGILDLFVGYDNRPIAESSRDMTTFQSPFGLLRLTTLPMGWSNSVPIFHDDVTYILRDENPEYTIPYIDDVPVKGPKTRYERPDGSYETIAENPGIRRFVKEHFETLNRLCQRMKYAGGTYSGKKSILIAAEFTVLGYRCTYEGRIPEEDRVAVIRNWGPCKNLSEVRAFLGTVGVLRIWIKNFAHRAHHLVKLTRKGADFEWGPDQEAAQKDLVDAVLSSPALRPLDYESIAPIILAVDTSYIAVGYFLAQCDEKNPRVRYYNRFGSITLNDREARFSQPKLEIYGLFRAFKALRLYIIGVRNLVVEVDASHIKGMLQNPDILPSASINRWIVAILTFHFHLVHVPGSSHGPDGLSRRPRQPGDPEPEDDDDVEDIDWIDQLLSQVHLVNDPLRHPTITPTSIFAFATPTVEPRTSAFIQEEPDNGSDEERSDSESSDDEDEHREQRDPYSSCPRHPKAARQDAMLRYLLPFFDTLERPSVMSNDQYKGFLKFAINFFSRDGRLWRKDPERKHKLVVFPQDRMRILTECHDEIGHRGVFATRSFVGERFWWPNFKHDVAWFVKTCHLCQTRQTVNILIPPTIAHPAPVFSRIYIDTMHLPPSGGFNRIIIGRCAIVNYPEWRMLRRETAKAIGDWVFQDILCRWGTIVEIITDNGAPIIKAVDYLATKYHINHIRISGYNSRANGIVERGHFDVRQALFKAADGEQAKWSQVAHSVFWSDRITTRKRMGVSPYFALTGTHPLIPLDIAEATYLLPPPESTLTTTELIARRAIELQKRSVDLARITSKVFEARIRAARIFERDHQATIKSFDFKRGDLVLIRNTAIEKSLNRKMRARYLGPLIIVARNRGGAYIVCELDGTVHDRPIAAFRVIPYFARQKIDLPDNFEDITPARLRAMTDSNVAGEDSDSAPRVRDVDDLSDTDDSDAESRDEDDRDDLPEE